MSLKLAIFGGRDFTRQDWVEQLVDDIPGTVQLHLCNMPGVSRWAEDRRMLIGMRSVVYAVPRQGGNQRESEEGRLEFIKKCQERNVRLVEAIDAAVFFYDGGEPNSRHNLQLCMEKGVPVFVVGGNEPKWQLGNAIDWVHRLNTAMEVKNSVV